MFRTPYQILSVLRDFKFPTAALPEIPAFWNVTPCQTVVIDVSEDRSVFIVMHRQSKDTLEDLHFICLCFATER